MKKKYLVISVLYIIVLAGCKDPEISVDKKDAGSKTEIQTAQSVDTGKYTEEAENMNEKTVEQIKKFLMSEYEFESENAVRGAAVRLNNAGCGEVQRSELKDDSDDVYVIELTDEKGDIFCFNIDHQGYIGPIRDKEGNYLYTPID